MSGESIVTMPDGTIVAYLTQDERGFHPSDREHHTLVKVFGPGGSIKFGYRGDGPREFFNPNHRPAGDEHGGEFAPAPGGVATEEDKAWDSGLEEDTLAPITEEEKAWEESLDEKQRAAVHAWCFGSNQIIAENISKGRVAELGDESEGSSAFARDFLHAMDAAPTFEGTVYRGTSLKPGQMATTGILKEGAVHIVHKPFGTSEDLDVAGGFTAGVSRPVLIRYRLKNGFRLGDAAPYEFRYEGEVIVRPGTKLRVSKVWDDGHGTTMVNMDEVADD